MKAAVLDLLQAEPGAEERHGLEVTVARVKAAVEVAQAAVDRLKPLQQQREISAAQFYDVQQVLVQAQLQQRSAEAPLELLLAGPKPEAVAEAEARGSKAPKAL